MAMPSDPDANYVPASARREVDDLIGWTLLRDHPATWTTAAGETWEHDPFTDTWRGLGFESRTFTDAEFREYREACEDDAAFRRALLEGEVDYDDDARIYDMELEAANEAYDW